MNVNSYDGKTWGATEHDLDWIFVRDGIAWGVEIKNTWAYIDRPEMYAKISLCEDLGLRPLFIMRWRRNTTSKSSDKGKGSDYCTKTSIFRRATV